MKHLSALIAMITLFVTSVAAHAQIMPMPGYGMMGGSPNMGYGGYSVQAPYQSQGLNYQRNQQYEFLAPHFVGRSAVDTIQAFRSGPDFVTPSFPNNGMFTYRMISDIMALQNSSLVTLKIVENGRILFENVRQMAVYAVIPEKQFQANGTQYIEALLLAYRSVNKPGMPNQTDMRYYKFGVKTILTVEQYAFLVQGVERLKAQQ